MRRTVQALALLALLAFSSALAPAQRRHMSRWELLGQANVDGAMDHDTIQVGANNGPYRSIQIRVLNAGVQFDRVIVHFGDGADQSVIMRSRIPEGGHTRAIDLPGNRRLIRSVEFWYARAHWGSRRPKVLLFGRR